MDPTPFLPDGWIGDDISLTCPHGNRMEWDGSGPCGCVSPLREQGMI